MNKVKILNVEISNVTQQHLLENLTKGVLVTPNVDDLVKMQYDKEYFDIVKSAEWVICDSNILFLCSKLLKNSLKEAIPGSSFFTAFYEYHKDDENCKIFLLGGMDGVAKEAMKRINEKVGRKMVVDAYSPSFGFEKNVEENEYICKIINESGANVVLVGVGSPKQQKWINNHKAKMPDVDIWMALGATIDFEAGHAKRAPMIWRKLYLEWLYRFIQEPKRLFRRYFVKDTRFFVFFLKYLLGLYRDPFE